MPERSIALLAVSESRGHKVADLCAPDEVYSRSNFARILAINTPAAEEQTVPVNGCYFFISGALPVPMCWPIRRLASCSNGSLVCEPGTVALPRLRLWAFFFSGFFDYEVHVVFCWSPLSPPLLVGSLTHTITSNNKPLTLPKANSCRSALQRRHWLVFEQFCSCAKAS